jgi:hypothetical protein
MNPNPRSRSPSTATLGPEICFDHLPSQTFGLLVSSLLLSLRLLVLKASD